ncbi:hypothetical protein KVV02_000015 [Mortierella alpina]|uniref:Peroxin-1 n=1 Tax=Mortierella alpina TaxID=64518 RepID=A0A9P8CZ73_MORAP|nr:hypothetical protein KVV02_000015 [Mortierella alpina]
MSPIAATLADTHTHQSYARLHSKLTLRPEETLHRDSDAALLRLHNTVQVTKPVWSQLCGRASSIDAHGSVPVAIVVSQDTSHTHTSPEHAPRPLLTAIVTRAVLLTSSIDGHVAETSESECFITAEFARTQLPSTKFDSPLQITLQRTDLAVLDEIILAATTTEAYEIISAEPTLISSYFLPHGDEPVIIRYDQTYNMKGPSGEPLPVKVLMCNSVLQGIMETDTSIIFTDMAGQVLDRPKDAEFFESAISSESLHFLDDGEDPFDFDGDFMTSQFLVKDPSTNSKSTFKDLHFSVAELEDDEEDAEEEEDNNTFSDVIEDSGDEIDGRKIHKEVNGHGRRIRSFSNQPEPVEEIAPLVKKTLDFSPWVQTSHYPSHMLSPQPAPEEDPEARIFVDVAQLGKLRVFSGDWVLVSVKEPRATSRFCRIYGLSLPSASASKELPRVYLPAGLHFNLGSPSRLTIDAAHLKQEELAVAKAVTVARVASPPTVDKALQSACLEALKEWFEEYERVVCEGDVIGVEIDEEAAKLTLKPSSPGEDIDIRLPLAASDQKTTIYFKLTHLDDSSSPNKHTQLVDPTVTKMIQSGLEHSRVPSRLRRHARSPANPALDDPSAPLAFSQLYQLVSSGLHPFSSKLGLNCTVLLHGARGIGKKTVVDWVADLAGIHIMEVNCFDIASDTDAKTEVAVRAKFDKAVACGPCILLLRHIDALARKSVALETGQEPILSTVLKDCFTQLGEAFKTMGHPVTVIATTGDIDKVPTSVLGCFLHEIGFDAPNEAQRLAILKNLTAATPLGPDVSLSSLATQTAALVAKDLVDLTGRAGLVAIDRVEKSMFRLHPSLDLANVAEKCPFNYTGADFYALCSDAMLKAMSRTADSIENRVAVINEDETSTLPRPITSQYYLDHLAQPDEILVQVTEEDFDQALAELIPSVSAQELEHYKQVQKMFNSDDFAKEAEAAAAAEEKKRADIQEERELAAALRKVEEAQRILSSEQDAALHEHNGDKEERDLTARSRKGKGRAAEYSHVEEHSSQQKQEQHSQFPPEQRGDSVTAQYNGETGGSGLEEPLMVGQQDQESIQQTLDQQTAEGAKGPNDGGKGKGKGKGKGRK